MAAGARLETQVEASKTRHSGLTHATNRPHWKPPGDTHMRTVLQQLYCDELGSVITAEMVVLSTLMVSGLTVGANCVGNALDEEMHDVAQAVRSLDQSYSYRGLAGCRDACCRPRAWVAGSGFHDCRHDCPHNEVTPIRPEDRPAVPRETQRLTAPRTTPTALLAPVEQPKSAPACPQPRTIWPEARVPQCWPNPRVESGCSPVGCGCDTPWCPVCCPAADCNSCGQRCYPRPKLEPRPDTQATNTEVPPGPVE